MDKKDYKIIELKKEIEKIKDVAVDKTGKLIRKKVEAIK